MGSQLLFLGVRAFRFSTIFSGLLTLIVILSLAACGGGGGGTDTTPSYTAATSSGTGGSISSSQTIKEGASASFTISPDPGFLIDMVSGCDGSLSGDTYTTGTITADCTISVTFVARTLGAISPLFPTNGSKWNDYVHGGNYASATDTACAAATDTACLHGGEYRVVEVTSKSACTDLMATDDLSAFNWICDDSTGTARFISTGLADGKYLSDLIDFTSLGFKSNGVTVYEAGVRWAIAPASTWWTNSIGAMNLPGNRSLSTQSSIYVITASSVVASYSIFADKIALVVQPGITLGGPAAGGEVIYTVGHYLWIEGSMDASSDVTGVTLSNTSFAKLWNVSVKNLTGNGIVLTGSAHNVLSNVMVSNSGQAGVSLDGASSNTLSSVTVTNNVGKGLSLVASSGNNAFRYVTTSNNNIGLYQDSSSGNTFTDIIVSNNVSDGVYIANSSTNSLSGVISANNGGSGVALLSSSMNNTLNKIITANNIKNGIYLEGSNNTLSSVVSVNNQLRGLILATNSDNNSVSDLAAGYNSTAGIVLNTASNNKFTGLLVVGNNTADCIVTGGTNPGLVDSTCGNGVSSSATLSTNVNLNNAFFGKVYSETQNKDGPSGTSDYALINPATFDWSSFENRFRHWGIDGSTFPNTDQRGHWAGGLGRIWDWRLLTTDSSNNGNPALLNVIPVPTGSDFITHVWDVSSASTPPGSSSACDAIVPGSKYSLVGDYCFTNYLRGAVEIADDGVGNDNALCESGETCLYTPNIGDYQGSGNLISAGTFTNGTVTGVTLLKYESNGYSPPGGGVISI